MLDLRATLFVFFFFLKKRRPPRSSLDRSSATSDVYKKQDKGLMENSKVSTKEKIIIEKSPLIRQRPQHAISNQGNYYSIMFWFYSIEISLTKPFAQE